MARTTKLKKGTAALLAVLLLACALLAGCGRQQTTPRPYQAPRMPFYQQPQDDPQGDPQPLPTPEARGDSLARSSVYGSVGLLGFPSVLVSVYLNEAGGRTWDEAAIAQSRANLAVAVDWINAQCAAYNAAAPITYDDGSDGDLCVRMDYNGTFAGGKESEEPDELYEAADLLCERLDTAALREKYGTSSIGFLFFLPLAGSSFTMVHYAGDGDAYYYEYSCLYRDDAYSAPGTFDSPAVYAHEILHLYGAPDLYDGSTDDFVSPELVRFVGEHWPTAIMQDTYSAGGGIDYQAIDRSISPVTAYRLGLCGRFDGLEQFPALAATTPGIFEDASAGRSWQDDPESVAARPAA